MIIIPDRFFPFLFCGGDLKKQKREKAVWLRETIIIIIVHGQKY